MVENRLSGKGCVLCVSEFLESPVVSGFVSRYLITRGKVKQIAPSRETPRIPSGSDAAKITQKTADGLLPTPFLFFV